MNQTLVTIAFHPTQPPSGPRGVPIRAHASEGLAWLNINSYVDSGFDPSGPGVTVFFGNRAEVKALISALYTVADTLLDDSSRQVDREGEQRASERRVAAAHADGNKPATADSLIPRAGGFSVREVLAEESQILEAALLGMLPAHLKPQPEPVTLRHHGAPALDCTCPRYPGGGRKETAPTCPLHSGDARD